MAHVTRCPYCSSIWLLPNKDIAQNGPVKCSRCGHSFDAMSSILEVPNNLFPGFEETPYAPTTQETVPAPQPEKNPAANGSVAETTKPVADIDGRMEPSVGNLRNIAIQNTQTNSNEAAHPGNETALKGSEKEDDSLQTSSLSHIIPANSAPSEGPAAVTHHAAKKSSGIGSLVLIFVLLAAIAAVCSVIFNQQVIEKFPQTKELYTQACQKIPCPGFYLSNIEAFVVSKTNLIAAGEPGNYNLEVTVINGSNHAQAIPHLELQLVDESDTLLQKCLLTPEQFQVNAQTTKSVAAGRALNVRVAIQTNVTPSRCVVIPVYP